MYSKPITTGLEPIIKLLDGAAEELAKCLERDEKLEAQLCYSDVMDSADSRMNLKHFSYAVRTRNYEQIGRLILGAYDEVLKEQGADFYDRLRGWK